MLELLEPKFLTTKGSKFLSVQILGSPIAERKISPISSLKYLKFIQNEVDLIDSGRLPKDSFAIRFDFLCNRILERQACET